MKLIWTDLAVTDRRTIFSYIDNDNPSAAANIDELFSSAAVRLAALPLTGRRGRVSGTRELAVHRHYILIYEIRDERVLILRVLHSAQKWPSIDHPLNSRS